MSMLKDCYLLCFLLFFTIYLVIKCRNLKNEILFQKEAFTEILGHDLRVPVIAQIRGLDLIGNPLTIPENQQYLLDVIHQSCTYTLDMINMLIKIYSIENGTISLKYEKFSVYEILNPVLNELSDIIEDKAADINFTINETILYADKEAVRKALKILIYIALQYSEYNSVLKISVNNSSDKFNLILTYSGREILYGEYKRIFSKKQKFSAVGHGLQMYLCKKIIDLHNGKIKLSAENHEKIYSFQISIPNQRKAIIQGFPCLIKQLYMRMSLQNLI